MVDVDSQMLAADPELLTTLAVALECAMLMNDEARAAYARIYGREWEPLSHVFSGNHSGPTTTAKTIR